MSFGVRVLTKINMNINLVIEGNYGNSTSKIKQAVNHIGYKHQIGFKLFRCEEIGIVQHEHNIFFANCKSGEVFKFLGTYSICDVRFSHFSGSSPLTTFGQDPTGVVATGTVAKKQNNKFLFSLKLETATS